MTKKFLVLQSLLKHLRLRWATGAVAVVLIVQGQRVLHENFACLNLPAEWHSIWQHLYDFCLRPNITGTSVRSRYSYWWWGDAGSGFSLAFSWM